MLAVFCLRLAAGLLAALLVLRVTDANPRFFRAHFLTCLGLTAAAGVFLAGTATTLIWCLLALTLLGCFAGSLVWALEGAPLGKSLIYLSTATASAAMISATLLPTQDPSPADATAVREIHALDSSSAVPVSALVTEAVTSSLLLGFGTTAMLMGHSYLTTPTMSLRPLFSLLTALMVAVILRALVAGAGLWLWTRDHSLARLDAVTLWLPVRWLVGLAAPAILAILAWKTAQIRSTQSATGILYVVVILVFLGEVLSMVLFRHAGEIL